MKKYSPIDIAFFAALCIFSIIWIYELIKLLSLYYSFFRATILFLFICLIYFLWKNRRLYSFYVPKVSKQTENLPSFRVLIWKYLLDLKRYKELIVYICFILLCISIIVSMLFNTGTVLLWSIVWFYSIYFLAKLWGFKLNFQISKGSIMRGNGLKFFLITLGGFIVMLTIIFNWFNIELWERNFWYVILSGIYLLLGWVLFFSWDLRLWRLFSVYNILSLFLIWGLVWFLAFQNGFFSFLDPVEEKPVIQREEWLEDPVILEPNIISDEVEVVYETKTVSEAYFLNPGLQLWSSGDQVKPLQEVLLNLWYFNEDIDGEFDEPTRLALVNALRDRCWWPESTRGIFGPQAKACIDTLEISVPVENIETLQEEVVSEDAIIVSEEVESGSWETLDDISQSGALLDEEIREETENIPEETNIEEEISENNGNTETLWVEEVSYETRSVRETYSLVPDLRLWSSWEAVSDLQRVLGTLQYYIGDITWNFDEATWEALTNALRTECWWPASTRWIFGPLAKTCIDSLNIPVSQ